MSINDELAGIFMGGAVEFNPASLFSGGEIGFFYNPSPLTCYTDISMTTPAGDGDLVAAMVDSSGNFHTVSQVTSANRQTLRQTVGGKWYLDPVQGDYLWNPSVNILDITSPDAGSVVCGMNQAGSDPTNTLFSVGPTNTNTLNILATFNNNFFYDYGDVAAGGRVGPMAQPAGWDDNNHTLEAHRDGTQADFLIDGSSLFSGAGFSSSIVSQNVQIYLGSDTQQVFMFTGRIYSLFVRGVVLTAQEKISMQDWTDERSEVSS